MPDWTSQNLVTDEVMHSVDKQITLNSAEIDQLIERASLNERKRIRFCAHESPTDQVHEMLIVHPREAYVRPHSHLNKIESMMVLKGEVDHVIFEDDGSVRSICPMGELSSGKTFYNSLREATYHTLLIRSEWLVFLEVTQGPFDRKDTMFLESSPEENDPVRVKEYLTKLEKELISGPLRS